MGGGPSQKIMPLCGSILQDKPGQILSLAENQTGPNGAKLDWTGLELSLAIDKSTLHAHQYLAKKTNIH